MSKTCYFSVLCLVLLVLTSCSGEGEQPFRFSSPDHFPEPTYTFDNNPVSLEGFELGKLIFNDPILSRDSSISCASCHDQIVAFADPQHRLSIGIESRVGQRNAPPIFNLAYMNDFFWDGGVAHMDFIPLNPIANPVEMDQDIEVVIEKMNQDARYRRMFKAAFGTEAITTPRMLHAMSQFMVMMVSSESKYDDYLLGKTALKASELAGLEVFESKCQTCHAGVLFTDQSFRSNGLDQEVTDEGRGAITGLAEDMGTFKIPSLRNVSLTAPYMHDGRFESLEEVLEHYAAGVRSSPNLDPLLIENDRLGIALTDQEKANILAFLETLTDYDFVSNPLFFAP